MSDESNEDEHEEHHHRTISERVALLELRMTTHLQTADKSFAKNDAAHEQLMTHIRDILARVDGLHDRLSRYDWLARGVMLTLFAIGMIGGWFLERWHLFMGWLRH